MNLKSGFENNLILDNNNHLSLVPFFYFILFYLMWFLFYTSPLRMVSIGISSGNVGPMTNTKTTKPKMKYI